MISRIFFIFLKAFWKNILISQIFLFNRDSGIHVSSIGSSEDVSAPPLPPRSACKCFWRIFWGKFEFVFILIYFTDGSMTFSSSRSSRMSTFSSLTAMETTSLTSTTSPTIVTSSSNLDHAGTGSVSPVRFYFSYSFF